MLLCTVHSRVYAPWLKRWLPVDPVQMQGVSTVIPVIEGTCDECLATVKACLFMQFPDLYDASSSVPLETFVF